MIELIWSLCGYSDSLRRESKPTSVQNGLHQSRTVAPTLILYYELVINRWLSWCQSVEVWCKLGGKLLEREQGDRALLYYQNACLQVMLLWCASVERIGCHSI